MSDQSGAAIDEHSREAGIPVAQYVRMSTEHQKYSTENQAAAISEYASLHGMRIVKTYEDSGKSGLNLKGRPGLQSLLNDVQQPSPGFQAILVYDVSRWGRFPDPDEAAAYAHACKSRGVHVIYCAEPFNNDGSISSTVLIGLKRSMSAEYVRELGVKVFHGACNIVRHGFRQGGAPGYGLRRQLIDEQHNVKGLLSRGERKSIQTDRIILVPGPQEEIAVVHRIYQLFLEGGMPERVIAAVLNREGLVSDMGIPWTRGTIHQILTNEKYIGNNVYNRTSFKLKIQHVRNPPEQWVRRDGAFEAIVPLATFMQVQAIIAARSHHLDDGQMLGMLRQTLERHGALSGIVIDEDDDAPSSSAYRSRFGSLLRAYSLIGYTPPRDYAYLEINRELRRRHPELIEEMAYGLQQAGGWIVRNDATDLITVNGEFTTSMVIARCKPTPSGTYRWHIRFDASLHPDITVVVRMDPSNRRAHDYYVFPAIDFSAETLPTLEDNGFTLDAYRTDSLDSFYQLGILCITSFSAFPTQLNQQVTSANLSEIGVMQRLLSGANAPTGGRMTSRPPRVEMILIAEITVANPRMRNPKIHKTITESIEQIGLKRPITVRRVQPGDGELPYALICGQGRLESCKLLGQSEIAALVLDVDEETGHVMSIVENVARRTPRAVETMEQVRVLKQRGYSDAEIATKLGCTAAWVNNVANLLERGEKRLLAAAEAGHIPLHLAVSISRASDSEAQQLLLAAYEVGELKGRKVAIMRKILEQRVRSGKKGNNTFTKASTRKPMTPEELAKLYKRDVEMHRRIQKKSEFAQQSLLLARQIFKELFANKEFCTLLKAEKLTSVPQPLVDLLPRGGLGR